MKLSTVVRSFILSLENSTRHRFSFKGKLWLFIACLLMLAFWVFPKPAAFSADLFNDAYSFEDDFDSNAGLDLTATLGFHNPGGYLEADQTVATAVSQCISLPQPNGGTFIGWSFLDIGLADLGDTISNTLEIQDCAGNRIIEPAADLITGGASVDLSTINPVTYPAISLKFTVVHTAPPGAGATPARLDYWKVYGRAEGVTILEVTPDSDIVDAGSTISFNIRVTSNGATTRNPVLRVSLDDINGLHTLDVDDGLAQDAEVDYGNGGGLQVYHPLEFISASDGPNGEKPTNLPVVGATLGEMVWNLDSLSDGFSDSLIVTLKVPEGYVISRTLALRATLEHGLVSQSGDYTNQMDEEGNSTAVTVSSVHALEPGASGTFNVSPGAVVGFTFYIYNSLVGISNPSDIEDITMTISGIGDCTPLFHELSTQNTLQVLQKPAPGELITSENPVVVHIDRVQYVSAAVAIGVSFIVPNNCPENSEIGLEAQYVGGHPSWSGAVSRSHLVVTSICRSGYNITYRLMSGNENPNNFYRWPQFGEAYINRGSGRAGEYLGTWTPAGVALHTVPLNHSYNLVEIPDGVTFHGVRYSDFLDRLYKDCTGTAPLPDDQTFDHDSDPPHLAWTPVLTTWPGGPFTQTLPITAPDTIVLPKCRLLGVKDTDNPAWVKPESGRWATRFIWRMCDGSYGCDAVPDGTAISLIPGTIYTHQTFTTTYETVNKCPFADPPNSNPTYGGWAVYQETKSWPRVYTWPEQNQVPAGQSAQIILNPENANQASQYVDGRWGINLFNARNAVDLQRVTGTVLTGATLYIPNPDQNLIGQSCNIDDIVFHAPDAAGCLAATSAEDPACLAWWEVPPACQPPNGWGYKIADLGERNDYKQLYRFRLNAPIKQTILAGTPLDFVAEVRTNDLSARGADNVVTDTTRWPATNYVATTTVTILDIPGLDVSTIGPSVWPLDNQLTYKMTLTNTGNTPNPGLYLVDWLPRAGTNGNDFTPIYDHIFVNQPFDVAVVKYGTQTSCFTDPPDSPNWIPMILTDTIRLGYQVKTIEAVAENATCILVHLDPDSGSMINPDEALVAALDLRIPRDNTLLGSHLFNRSAAGARTAFNSASEIARVETANVQTLIIKSAIIVNDAGTAVADDGKCTLVEAISSANTDTASGSMPGECSAGQEADVIILQAPSPYVLTDANPAGGADGPTGLPSFTSTITIIGDGAAIERADIAPDFRIFHVAASGVLTLNQVLARNGQAPNNGGGMFISGGTVTLLDSTLSNNRANEDGGGIYNSLGLLKLTNSVAVSNSASSEGGGIFNNQGIVTLANSLLISNSVIISGGGGIANNGFLGITNSTISDNSAGSGGGGILNWTGVLTLTNSSVSHNRANIDGGGIFNGNNSSMVVTNTIIMNNTSNVGGGGIYNYLTSTLTLFDSAVTGNSANDGGGAANFGSTLALIDSMISENSANISGGGIYNDNGGLVELTNSTISDNRAISIDGGGIDNFRNGIVMLTNSVVNGNSAGRDGGGINNFEGVVNLANSAVSGNSSAGINNGVNGAVTVTDSTISSNSAHRGGGILNAGVLTLTNSMIIHNEATGDDGGGIYNNGGALTLINSAAVSNSAVAVGGGIFNTSGQIALINSSLISNSTVISRGGGLANQNGSVTLTDNSLVQDNQAEDNGGGIYNLNGTVTLTNSAIISNYSRQYGGGIRNDGGMVRLADTSVSGNISSQTGGGIDNGFGGTLEVMSSTISANRAVASGGISNIASTATLVNSTVRGNTSENDGGGLGSDSGLLTLISSTVSDNEAGGTGGGIEIGGNPGSRVTLISSTVVSNRANSAGGGIQGGGVVNLIASTIMSNSAVSSDGGGIYIDTSGALTATNSTISGNNAAGGGGGVVSHDGTLTFINSTLSNNSASEGGGIFNQGAVNLINTIVAAQQSGTDCAGDPVTSNGHNLASDASCNLIAAGDLTNTNPLLGPLTDNGGETLTHALLPGSPTIDAGDNSACPATDQRGVSRPQGLACDIGAYEFQVTQILVVNTPDDLDDNLCDLTHCSLREAINAANATVGISATITFNILAPGPHTIQPATALPDITAPVIIDGYTQPGASPNTSPPELGLNAVLMIELDGSNLGGSVPGLRITAGSSTVRGLVINRFGRGIELTTQGGNVIEGNFIGTDVAGAAALGNTSSGITILDAPNNTIGGTTPEAGNLISGNSGHGLEINGPNATGNRVQGNFIGTDVSGTLSLGNGSHGILVEDSATNTTIGGGTVEEANTIAFNGGAGVVISSTTNNPIRSNAIFANAGLGIDLGDDELTPNDSVFDPDTNTILFDQDTGANNLQNYPILIRAAPLDGALQIRGWLNSISGTTYTVDLYASPACDPANFGEGEHFLGSTSVTTSVTGTAVISEIIPLDEPIPLGRFVTATATDPEENTSEFSNCISVSDPNTVWTEATTLTLEPDPSDETSRSASIEQYLDLPGRARWYKFEVKPSSRLTIDLKDLPANYDLLVFKDIEAAHQTLTTSDDLVRLGVEFAADAHSPMEISPLAISPINYSPLAFSPMEISPMEISPMEISPMEISPMEISPMEISPMEISPLAFSPMEISPMEISPEAYAGAQFRSLIGFSALEATANERIIVDTWDNADHFYVRVQGRNGAFSLAAPFQLDITMHSETCGEVSATHLPVSSLGAEERNYKTLILVDWTRMARTYLETRTLEMKLNQFASREEIAGRVINVKQDDRVAAANKLADENHRCPYAKNLVAAAIKEIVTRYREVNPLEYVVIVGDDDVIPYVRHPDKSTLGNEKEYVPPVLDNTTSQASLQLGYVLSQDFYGSKVDISLQENNFPVPELAVGRLVETPDDIMAVLEAYAQTDGGVVPIPTKALVTGYDFLEDAARAVQAELELGIALPVETLIADRNWSPEDPHSWTAGQLREQLLMPPDLDLAFLAGHFSANGALAADYRTSLTTSELANSTVDLTNAIIFSAGCHSGYNIVNSHGIPLVTKALDWPQAFAQKGATLIAGTGYQYGDTDFLEYSERLYLEFSRQLRVGTGPVSIGQALVAAKQTYLASLPAMRPIHEKSLLEATLFGLPMLSVNMPGERIDLTSEPSIVTGLTNFETDPGLTLGLAYTDVTLTPDLTEMTTQLEFPREALDEPSLMVTTTYFSGPNGVVTNPGEPVLPLAFYNISVPDAIIRGLGFRGGSYSDHTEVVPLIGAPTTEVRGIHRTFVGDSFYPIAPWRVNYFDRLTHPDGATRLMLTPAQYKSDPPGAETGILRSFDSMTLRLYYSDNTQTYGDNTPALSAPPSISTIAALAKGGVVTFTAQVVGNPAAGIQEVWVTYTAVDPGSPFANQWQSLDLTQDPVDGRVWQGTLNLEGTAAEAIRYMVQAVNGVGLVTRRDNLGAYFIPEIEPETPLPPPKPITIEIEAPPTMGAYNTTTTFNITVRSEDVPLTQTPVILNLGAQRYAVVTNEEGQASVTMPLLEATGVHEVQITVPGSSEYQAAVTTTPFEITRQSTSLSLEREVVAGQFSDETNFVATLAAGEQPLAERTVFFVATSQDVAGTTVMTIPVITDYAGRAYLGQALLPASTYTVQAVFSQAPPEPDEPPPPPDDRYDSSTISGELLISPEEAQVIYTGETVVGADGILHLSATVTQNDDGSLGNLAVAQVQYDVQHTNGTVMITTQAPVDENGHSATTLSGLPAGTYQVAVTVVGGFFSSPASSITFVNEADSRNQNGNFKFDSDELGDFTLKGGADPAASRITFDDLTAGSYSVTERGSRGRSLADVSCHLVGQEVRADYTLLYAKQGTLNGVTVHLSPSQHVICTFINVNPSGKQNVPTPSTSQIYLPLIFK